VHPPGKTSNTQHPTSNIQWTLRVEDRAQRSLGVGRWMLDVHRSFHSPAPRDQASFSVFSRDHTAMGWL
jgi:hypothetical protein